MAPEQMKIIDKTISISFDKSAFSTDGGQAAYRYSFDYLPNGQIHLEVPVHFELPVSSGNSVDPFRTYGVVFLIGGHTISGTYSNKMHLSNICFKDADNRLVAVSDSTDVTFSFYKGLNISHTNNENFGLNGFVCFDIAFDGMTSIPDLPDQWTIRTTFNYYPYLGLIKEEYTNLAGGQNVIDYAVVDEMKKSNATQEDTNTTTHSIFSSISSFFASFFENVINSFKSLFIPEDGYFTAWFNRLNTLLADKLGMLYAPFDLVISTLTAIMNADSSETGIPFPGIKWEDTWLVEPFTFTFSSLGNDMSDLRDTVYFATDVVLLFAFLFLLEEKIRHILED